ncbi:hypothetical protein GGI05_006243, partial [Coemansia sp. RSA 2603]
PGNERALQIRLLGEETAELERMIQRKNDDLDSAPNPIIRRRFEDIIQRLRQELEAKREQLATYRSEAAGGGAVDAAATSEDPGVASDDPAAVRDQLLE